MANSMSELMGTVLPSVPCDASSVPVPVIGKGRIAQDLPSRFLPRETATGLQKPSAANHDARKDQNSRRETPRQTWQALKKVPGSDLGQGDAPTAAG